MAVGALRGEHDGRAGRDGGLGEVAKERHGGRTNWPPPSATRRVNPARASAARSSTMCR